MTWRRYLAPRIAQPTACPVTNAIGAMSAMGIDSVPLAGVAVEVRTQGTARPTG
jgi:hypothetical protein